MAVGGIGASVEFVFVERPVVLNREAIEDAGTRFYSNNLNELFESMRVALLSVPLVHRNTEVLLTLLDDFFSFRDDLSAVYLQVEAKAPGVGDRTRELSQLFVPFIAEGDELEVPGLITVSHKHSVVDRFLACSEGLGRSVEWKVKGTNEKVDEVESEITRKSELHKRYHFYDSHPPGDLPNDLVIFYPGLNWLLVLERVRLHLRCESWSEEKGPVSRKVFYDEEISDLKKGIERARREKKENLVTLKEELMASDETGLSNEVDRLQTLEGFKQLIEKIEKKIEWRQKKFEKDKAEFLGKQDRIATEEQALDKKIASAIGDSLERLEEQRRKLAEQEEELASQITGLLSSNESYNKALKEAARAASTVASRLKSISTKEDQLSILEKEKEEIAQKFLFRAL